MITLVKIPTQFNPSDLGTQVFYLYKLINYLTILNVTNE